MYPYTWASPPGKDLRFRCPARALVAEGPGWPRGPGAAVALPCAARGGGGNVRGAKTRLQCCSQNQNEIRRRCRWFLSGLFFTRPGVKRVRSAALVLPQRSAALLLPPTPGGWPRNIVTLTDADEHRCRQTVTHRQTQTDAQTHKTQIQVTSQQIWVSSGPAKDHSKALEEGVVYFSAPWILRRPRFVSAVVSGTVSVVACVLQSCWFWIRSRVSSGFALDRDLRRVPASAWSHQSHANLVQNGGLIRTCARMLCMRLNGEWVSPAVRAATGAAPLGRCSSARRGQLGDGSWATAAGRRLLGGGSWATAAGRRRLRDGCSATTGAGRRQCCCVCGSFRREIVFTRTFGKVGEKSRSSVSYVRVRCLGACLARACIAASSGNSSASAAVVLSLSPARPACCAGAAAAARLVGAGAAACPLSLPPAAPDS